MKNLSRLQFGTLRHFANNTVLKSTLGDINQSTLLSLLRRGYLIQRKFGAGAIQFTLTAPGQEVLDGYENAKLAQRSQLGLPITNTVANLLKMVRMGHRKAA